MRIFIHKILKFVEHHNWQELFRRIRIAAIKPFYENRDMVVVKLGPNADLGPKVTLEAKELKLADIDQMFEVMYLSRTEIKNNFDEGSRCFTILDNGKIASYCWALFDLRQLTEVHWDFKLRPNQTWLSNAVTVKNARGKGYYPSLFRYIAQTLKTEKFDEFFGNAEEKNIASLKGLGKAGCRQVVKVEMKKVLSKIGYKIKVFDEKAWNDLLQKSPAPHKIWSIEKNQ